MLTASCILRVRSPYYGWAEASLRSFEIEDPETDPRTCHYIIIESDLSNIDDVLNWCLDHEEICAQIGANAREEAQRLLNIETIYATFSNILKFAKFTAYQASRGGGGKPLPSKKTRKQSHTKKQKTRKIKRVTKEEPLVLAEYRGGGVEREMEDYIQSTMKKLWSTYVKKLR
jgi:hypothetical protein